MFVAAKYVSLTCTVPVFEIEGSAAMLSNEAKTDQSI